MEEAKTIRSVIDTEGKKYEVLLDGSLVCRLCSLTFDKATKNLQFHFCREDGRITFMDVSQNPVVPITIDWRRGMRKAYRLGMEEAIRQFQKQHQNKQPIIVNVSPPKMPDVNIKMPLKKTRTMTRLQKINGKTVQIAESVEEPLEEVQNNE